jgi:hypothetical protein
MPACTYLDRVRISRLPDSVERCEEWLECQGQ